MLRHAFHVDKTFFFCSATLHFYFFFHFNRNDATALPTRSLESISGRFIRSLHKTHRRPSLPGPYVAQLGQPFLAGMLYV